MAPDLEQPSRLERWHKRWLGPLFAILSAVGTIIAIVVGVRQCTAPEEAAQQPKTVEASEDSRLYVGSRISQGSGPEREMYTGDRPPSDAALNSISDNPEHGDERNFTLCRVADRQDTYYDTVAVSDGTLVEIYVYIDNAATRPGAAIANAHLEVVAESAAVDDPRFQVVVSGVRQSDGRELKVWDGCGVNSDVGVRLVLVPGSGKLHSDADYPKVTPVSDDVLKGRQQLPGVGGGPAGIIPSSRGPYGYILFRMLAVAAR